MKSYIIIALLIYASILIPAYLAAVSIEKQNFSLASFHLSSVLSLAIIWVAVLLK